MSRRVLLALGGGPDRERAAAELERLGYEVRSSATSEDALRSVRSFTPDLIVIDRRLPGEGGISTLARALKELPGLRSIVASKGPFFWEDFSIWMADSFVRLPIVPAELARKVGRLLEEMPLSRTFEERALQKV